MYIPGVAEAAVDAVGDLTAAQQTGSQTAADNWFAALATATGARLYPPYLLHRSGPTGITPLPTEIKKFVLEKRVATQRRRMRP
jgi:hypothetical protein